MPPDREQINGKILRMPPPVPVGTTKAPLAPRPAPKSRDLAPVKGHTVVAFAFFDPCRPFTLQRHRKRFITKSHKGRKKKSYDWDESTLTVRQLGRRFNLTPAGFVLKLAPYYRYKNIGAWLGLGEESIQRCLEQAGYQNTEPRPPGAAQAERRTRREQALRLLARAPPANDAGAAEIPPGNLQTGADFAVSRVVQPPLDPAHRQALFLQIVQERRRLIEALIDNPSILQRMREWYSWNFDFFLDNIVERMGANNDAAKTAAEQSQWRKIGKMFPAFAALQQRHLAALAAGKAGKASYTARKSELADAVLTLRPRTTLLEEMVEDIDAHHDGLQPATFRRIAAAAEHASFTIAAAKERIVRTHLRYAHRIAVPYVKRGMDPTGIVAEATLVYWRLADKFDPAFKHSFIAFADRELRGQFEGAVQASRMIHIPAGLHDQRKQMDRHRRAELVRSNRRLSAEEAARKTGFSPDQVNTLMNLPPEPVRLENVAIYDGEAQAEAHDRLLWRRSAEYRHQQPRAIDHVFQLQIRGITTESLLRLAPREERVMRMRMGMGLKEEMTLEEVGHELMVSRERIRQLEVKALRKLQHWAEQDREKLFQLGLK